MTVERIGRPAHHQDETAFRNFPNQGKPKGLDGYTVGYGKLPLSTGSSPGEGERKRGSNNRLGEDFIEALAKDFEKHWPGGH